MTGEAVVIDARLESDLRTSPALVASIEAARAGDSAAFEEIMVLTERRVARIAWRILGDAEDVRDALQETFLRFFRHLDRVDSRRDPMGWLARIAVNVSCDLHRRRKRIRSLEPIDEAMHCEAGTPAADEALIRRNEVAALRRAIDALPTKQRLAILLHDVEGLPTNEVAAAIGSSVATVRVHLFRARASIRRRLGPQPGATS